VVKILPKNFPRWSELNPWLRGRDSGSDGQYAWLFDNASDCLSLDFDKVGFDITWLMDSVSHGISTPVYMVLLHRMQQSMDGTRLVSFILDEAWQVLNSPFWLEALAKWLPSIRKKNGHFIFMTQSPDTVLSSSISSVIRTNLATTIAFPNPIATRKVYVDGLGFSEAEFQTIKDTNPLSRLFLYRQLGAQSFLCRLDLSDLADEIRVFSSNEASVKLLDGLIDELGTDARIWLPRFLERSAP
jgi:type IV secretion system protein VirB4